MTLTTICDCLSGTKRPEREFTLLFGFLTRQTYLLRKPGMVCGIASPTSKSREDFSERTLSIRSCLCNCQTTRTL